MNFSFRTAIKLAYNRCRSLFQILRFVREYNDTVLERCWTLTFSEFYYFLKFFLFIILQSELNRSITDAFSPVNVFAVIGLKLICRKCLMIAYKGTQLL